MTYQTHQEFAKPGVDSSQVQERIDWANTFKPEDFDRLSKTMTESSGKADQALKEKGILPEFKLVDEKSAKHENVTSEEILKYGKTAAKDLNDTALKLLNKASGVFSPEGQTANKIDKMSKDILNGPWASDPSEKGLREGINKASEDKALRELTPEQRKQYESEKRTHETWERGHTTRLMIQTGDDPAPATPMMDRVGHRAREIQRQTREEVTKQLTPEERQELKQEDAEYAKKVGEGARQEGGPYDVTIYRAGQPKMGPMHRKLEERVMDKLAWGAPPSQGDEKPGR